MDTLVTVCALVAAILIKGLLFLIYTKYAEKKAPKKGPEFEIVQKGRHSNSKRVLLTGGCGYLGSAIARHLEERFSDKLDVVVLDAAIHTKFGPLLPGVTYIRGDICTYTHVHMALAGCECVLHTAGLVGDCRTPESAYQRVNEQGTRNVIEASLERDVRALVYTSSTSVLFSRSAAKPEGGGGRLDPAPETARPLPPHDLNSEYARSKAEAEKLVLAANSHVLRTVALRPGGVYGLDDPHIIPSVLAGKPYCGPGNVHVPVVWVEDAARGHVDAVARLLFPDPSPGAPRIHGRAYHLCHDPVRDPLLYSEIAGGPVVPESESRFGPKHESVRAKEAAAGVSGLPPPGVNAYGRPVNRMLPYPLVRRLAAVNFWVCQALGVVLVHPSLTPQNMRCAANNWPCDVADARRLLGWEPTPWRVVAARLGQEAAAAAAAGKDKGKGKAKGGAKAKAA